MRSLLVSLGLVLAVGALAKSAQADQPADAKGSKTFEIGGAYKLTAAESWAAKPPRSRIVEHEFAVPAAKGDELEGRVTVMGAGGTVEANVDRLMGQFTQPDGKSTKDRAQTEKKTIAGQEVIVLDLSGTYMDRPAPMSPGVERKDYRMLVGIIQTKKAGNSYIKFYGPERTVAANADAFNKMLDSLRSN